MLLTKAGAQKPCTQCIAGGQSCEARVTGFSSVAGRWADLLVEPVGVFNSGDRVGNALHGGRNGDDLLDGAAEALAVVVPVHDRTHIRHLIC